MILHCGISERNEFEIESGTHRTTSMIITLSGEYEYTAQNVTKRVMPYMPVIFKKGVSFHKKIINPISFIIIRFSQPLDETEIFPEYDEIDKPRLKNSIMRLEDAICRKLPIYIVEHFANDILFTANNYKTQKNANESDIYPAYEYIKENFDKNISLKDLSEISGYSVQTFINKFKFQYGTTPAKCITDFRIGKAKELLMSTAFPIGKISEICGYDNVYYFSNTFKKSVGMSPLRFRRSSEL